MFFAFFDHQVYIIDSFDQDFYNITIPLGSGTEAYIDAKFEATTAHITNATLTTLNPDQLYISFASAAFIQDTPVVTPQVGIYLLLIYFHTFHLSTSDICVGNWQYPGYESKALTMVN